MSTLSRLAVLRLAAVIVATMSVVCWGVADSQASEAKLEIAKFALQTTRTRTVTQQPLDHENWGFVNEPVAFPQANGHPNGQGGGADSLTTTIEFKSENVKYVSGGVSEPQPVPTRDPKDIVVNLPQGLLGNPTAVARCPLKMALNGEEHCPGSTQVGVAVIYLDHGEGLMGPIVNVIPEAGQSAEFAIETNHNINFVLTAHVVHTRQGYGLTVVTNSIPMNEIYRVETSFWGVPAAKIHDLERGVFCGRLPGESHPWSCQNANDEPTTNASGEPAVGERSGELETPFLTMPGDCAGGHESAVISADSWEEADVYTSATSTLSEPTGCNLLTFEPGIEVKPDTLLADAPVGLGVELNVPQLEQPDRLSTPELRNATVALPQGLSISPGIVDGIRACDERGPEGIDLPTGLNASGEPLRPGEIGEGEERGAAGEPQLAPGHCPDASIVGTAKATTPLLSEPIEGHVYLARPLCGGSGQAPCTEQDAREGRLYRLYLELGGQGALADAGVNIKVPIDTEANPATGQLTAVAEENPQLPFSKLEIKLNGGPRAPLANPPQCGPASTVAHLAPWSAPGKNAEGVFMAGVPDAAPLWFYDVDGCTSSPQLAPGFLAEMMGSRAGSFQPFELTFSRQDRQQYLSGIQLHTPPGLLGMLSSVPLCGEPAAAQGECPEASRIGMTTVASGAGSHPFEIDGYVYLTTSYRGAPFGLSIVTHVVAGPFNLGKVVVRARIDVDPTTSALTVSSDPLPQIVFGVPLRLQRIRVNIDRPDFMFNPTSCKAQPIVATVSGSAGAIANVTSPFAAGDCKSLRFKPKFAVRTSGHTSRKGGASLDAKLSYPKGALGIDANIARVKVSLPKQLPSRLPTLQKACPVATFDANPGRCPRASIVGIARTSTPVLPVGLTGPVYFVSHGGEAFPQLIVVLQGDGVRVDLAGNTFISKGITSTTFQTVPDVPVNSFELYLPEGNDSALGANGSLCQARGRLFMPTEFVAQNGLSVHQRTKIQVGGCAKGRVVVAPWHHKQGRAASGVSVERRSQVSSGIIGRTR